MTDDSTTTLSSFGAGSDQSAEGTVGSETSGVPNGPSLAVENIDVEELYAVKLKRAHTDPRIAHTPSIGYAPDQDHYVYELTAKARLVEAIGTHPLYRLEKATWPEVAIYCMSATGDARVIDGRFVRIYKFALVQVLQMNGLDESALPSMLQNDLEDGPLLPEDSDARRLAEGLREHIKDAQDAAFVSSTYDDWEVDGVPKRFWTRFGGVNCKQSHDQLDEGTDQGTARDQDEESTVANASLDQFMHAEGS